MHVLLEMLTTPRISQLEMLLLKAVLPWNTVDEKGFEIVYYPVSSFKNIKKRDDVIR